jgi:2-keto-4-pentenoate hydratase
MFCLTASPHCDPVVAVSDHLLRARQGGPAADDQALHDLLASAEQAYAVQERVFARLGGAPGGALHWKSGGATRSDVQRHAPLDPHGVRPTGTALHDLPLRHRWIEAEIALRIGRDVPATEAQAMTADGALALVDAMCVSIEVLDSRWVGARSAAPLLKLADSLMHGALVLGEFVPFSPRAWDRQHCRVKIGAAAWQSFEGSLGVGDPAWVLPAWLRHAARHGDTVRAGTVVSCGSWCGVLEAQAGDLVIAEFPGIGEARVQL